MWCARLSAESPFGTRHRLHPICDTVEARGFSPASRIPNRRAFRPGVPHASPTFSTGVADFFVTFVTAGRRPLFQVERNAALLVKLFASDCERCRYQLHAWVAMTDHVHLIMTPAQDVSLEKAIQFIKGGFSFQSKSRSDVWQRGFAEHRIGDVRDFELHAEYIAQNPVRAGPAGSSREYAWSHLPYPESVAPMPGHFQHSLGL
jgi:putative transposase